MRLEQAPSTGLAGIDMTTAGHLFSPRETFSLVHEVNKSLPGEMQMEIEIYTPKNRIPLTLLQKGIAKTGISLPLPEPVTTKEIEKWQGEYPLAKVSRVHLPFDYNTTELLAGCLDFIKKGDFTVAFRQALWMAYFGGAKNMHGIKIAENLGIGINAHANVIAGLALDNRLDDIKKQVPYIMTEVEEKHTTPLLSNEDSFGVPHVAVAEIVKEYQIDGILIGFDHLNDSVNIEEELENKEVQEYTLAMHFAGEDHTIFNAKERKTHHLLEKIAQTPFTHNVKAALDFNPLQMRHLTSTEQISLIKGIVHSIMATQPHSLIGNDSGNKLMHGELNLL